MRSSLPGLPACPPTPLRRRAALLVGLTALVGGSGRAMAAPVPAPGGALRVDFQRYRLDNGLTVILHEDHRVPTVTVNLLVRVGSKDERRGRTGFAHLFEHLMFMGTRAVPSGEFDRLMESEGGANDAETNEDVTIYHELGPRHLLETFLYLEADRFASLADEMTQAKLDLQREVVLNERRQSYDDKPYGAAELALTRHLFPESHPYHHPVIGSVSDLRAASVDDVRDFFRTFYRPGNTQLVIAGDFAPDEARRFVERYFGWIPSGPAPRLAHEEAPPLGRSQSVTLHEAVEQPRITVAVSTPRAFAEGDAECQLLAAVLARGKASRLHRALVQEGGLAQSVEAEQQGLRHGGWLAVHALGLAGGDAAALEKALADEVSRLATSPPTEAELQRARAMLQTETLRRLEHSVELARELNLYEFHFGDPAELGRRALARYDEVSIEDLARVARRLFSVEAPRLLVRVLPRSELKADTRAGAAAP